MIVPLVVPIIDSEKSAFIEDGEIVEASGSGTIALYGPPTDMGYLSAENNAQRIKQAVLENPVKMSSHGISLLSLGDLSSNMFPGMCEVTIDFKYRINVNYQEDAYWQPIY